MQKNVPTLTQFYNTSQEFIQLHNNFTQLYTTSVILQDFPKFLHNLYKNTTNLLHLHNFTLFCSNTYNTCNTEPHFTQLSLNFTNLTHLYKLFTKDSSQQHYNTLQYFPILDNTLHKALQTR